MSHGDLKVWTKGKKSHPKSGRGVSHDMFLSDMSSTDKSNGSLASKTRHLPTWSERSERLLFFLWFLETCHTFHSVDSKIGPLSRRSHGEWSPSVIAIVGGFWSSFFYFWRAAQSTVHTHEDPVDSRAGIFEGQETLHDSGFWQVRVQSAKRS